MFPSFLLTDLDIEVPHGECDVRSMGRRRRPYMPGAVFHITARTQGRVDYFDPRMRDHIREAMATVQQHTDAKLRAFVIMSNHMHVVLQQGVAPLATFMMTLTRL